MPLPDPRPGATALVTGASSGIGEQLARALAARGHHVTLVARRAQVLEGLAEELGGAQAAAVVAADLADPAARDGLGTAVEREVDVLVNAAGWGIYEPFVAVARERALAQVRLLVEAVVDLDARYVPAMVRRGAGAVINLSSTAGFQPLPYNADYAAAKAFVLLHSEALHDEVAEAGVTVTAVCPGPVRTGFQAASDARFSERLPSALWTSPERVADDALRAVARGQRSIVPGGRAVQAAFTANRFIPPSLSLPVSRRLMDTRE